MPDLPQRHRGAAAPGVRPPGLAGNPGYVYYSRGQFQVPDDQDAGRGHPGAPPNGHRCPHVPEAGQLREEDAVHGFLPADDADQRGFPERADVLRRGPQDLDDQQQGGSSKVPVGGLRLGELQRVSFGS